MGNSPSAGVGAGSHRAHGPSQHRLRRGHASNTPVRNLAPVVAWERPIGAQVLIEAVEAPGPAPVDVRGVHMDGLPVNTDEASRLVEHLDGGRPAVARKKTARARDAGDVPGGGE